MAVAQGLVAGAVAGFASIPHCAAMCGPLAGLACRQGGVRSPLLYHFGRALSYTLLGALAGAFGGEVRSLLPPSWVSTVLALTMAVVLGLAAWRIWRGVSGSSASGSLVPAARLHRREETATRSMSSPFARWLGDRGFLSRVAAQPLWVGLLTGVLPCGALLAALVLAAASGDVWAGAATMLAFAHASLLGLLAFAWFGSRRLQGWQARGLAVVFAAGAVVMLLRPWHDHQGHGHHSKHAEHDAAHRHAVDAAPSSIGSHHHHHHPPSL